MMRWHVSLHLLWVVWVNLLLSWANPQITAETISLPNPLDKSDFHDFDANLADIGRLLFFDPILSGNRNISCATCHSPDFATSDELPLGVGEGGVGIGRLRTTGTGRDRIGKRIPRNALPLWNLGAKEVTVLFYDGRLSVSGLFGNGFNSPAEEKLPQNLHNILAAQALLPLIAQFEMSGNPGENEVAGAINEEITAAWQIIIDRIRAIPEYVRMFVAGVPAISGSSDITTAWLGNALGAFVGIAGQSYDSPFDAYLGGEEHALSAAQLRGMQLFYGTAGCSSCHSGKLLSDFRFYALAIPQFGPGRVRRFDPIPRDVGRMAESDRIEDAYRFRTPPLRNVALTGPYGHNGAYATLEGIIRHHLQPLTALDDWSPAMVDLPDANWLEETDFITLQDRFEQQRLRSKLDIEPVNLDDQQVNDLVEFLHALTGTKSVQENFQRPIAVPSGLSTD